ncbi:MAG: DUF2382 domain-containing protein [Nocardioidaceae bacterium]
MEQPYGVNDMIGSDAYDPEGQRVGRVGQVYYDDQTGEASWITLNTGLFGTNESLVPLAGARLEGDRLVVAHPKSRIKDAPQAGDHDHLAADEESALVAYYGQTEDAGGQVAYPGGQTEDAGGQTEDAGGQTEGTGGQTGSGAMPTDDGAMTRSEEQLQVDTTTQARGRARLRKYTVIEQVQVTVPVRREKVVLETDTGETGDVAGGQPAAGESAGGGAGTAEASTPTPMPGSGQPDAPDMILYEERPVVTTETVPVERVRIGVEQELVEETIAEDVRKEQVVLEEDAGDGSVDR